jgi:hypothetical protein
MVVAPQIRISYFPLICIADGLYWEYKNLDLKLPSESIQVGLAASIERSILTDV